jgi:hypothetical protein
MCGELEGEDELRLERELHARFLVRAHALLKESAADARPPAGLADLMEALFRDALGRSLRDHESAAVDERYPRLSVQPVVFARLAGLIAGHLARGEDPLRKVVEALMLGYSEAEATTSEAKAPTREARHHHGDVTVRDR